ncbi:hypothetical protein QUF54_02600, partial [Candidatus Marithioploca araucensis]|nr:hypothetical protein [Candidatus Marithioploca araucensis]
KLSELSLEAREKIKSHSWDKIVGTPESSSPWGFFLDFNNPELMDIEGYYVLLPMQQEWFYRQTIQRCILSADGNTLILSFQDLSYGDNSEPLFLAICDKLPGEDFFLTTTLYESSNDSAF